MKTYTEKLKDPRWQKKRLQIMERDNFTCQKCESTTETLNVHHRHYRKGADPWDYEDWVFQTLCQPCHEKTSRLLQSLNEQVGAAMGDWEIAAILRFARVAMDTENEGFMIASHFSEILRVAECAETVEEKAEKFSRLTFLIAGELNRMAFKDLGL
jgi:hypothetical protein